MDEAYFMLFESFYSGKNKSSGSIVGSDANRKVQ